MRANPAAMSRRPQAQLTLAMRGGNAKNTIESERAQQMRVVTDQRGPQASFDLGYTHRLGRFGVIAVAIVKTGERYRTYPSPLFNQPPDQVNLLYPSRYAGLSSRVKSRAIVMGGALRVSGSLAIGASLSLARYHLEEQRTVWAGNPIRDVIGSAENDLLLIARAQSPPTPGLSIGAMFAPEWIAAEFVVVARGTPPTTLHGDARFVSTTTESSAPTPGPKRTASVNRPGVASVSAGIRYLKGRWTGEINATVEHFWRQGGARNWKFDELNVTRSTGEVGTLNRTVVLTRARARWSVGASADVSLVDGFLWLTGGYRTTTASIGSERRNPLLSEGQRHLLAVGIETLWAPFTITLGYTHSLGAVVTGATSLKIINPFEPQAGTVPSAQGRYQSTMDEVALTIGAGF